jgi:hypothetical protein
MRFFDSFLSPFDVIQDTTLGGVGLGMGTNAAAGLISGKRGFLLAEGEPARVLLESGPVIGSLYLLLRLAITVYLGWAALMSVKRHGRTLPLLLFSGCFNDMLQGQFSQPTELGYATIAGGLCLAATVPARVVAPAADAEPDEADPPPRISVPAEEAVHDRRAAEVPMQPPNGAHGPPLQPNSPTPPRSRGRSALAERLHAPEENEPRP